MEQLSIKRASAMLLAALGAVTAVQAQADASKLYVDARFGTVRTDVSSGALERDFARQGVDADVSSVDGKRQGYGLTLGYAVTDRLDVEAGYLDLGDAELRFSADSTDFDLAEIHPESGAGFTAGVRYSLPLVAGISAHVRAGAFAWEGDYDTHRGSAQVDDDSESAVDLYWGVGAGYAVTDRLGIDVEYRRIEFSRYPAEFVTIGAQWRFGR